MKSLAQLIGEVAVPEWKGPRRVHVIPEFESVEAKADEQQRIDVRRGRPANGELKQAERNAQRALYTTTRKRPTPGGFFWLAYELEYHDWCIAAMPVVHRMSLENHPALLHAEDIAWDQIWKAIPRADRGERPRSAAEVWFHAKEPKPSLQRVVEMFKAWPRIQGVRAEATMDDGVACFRWMPKGQR